MPCTILLFLKYPEPGKVKTRLAASVGAGEAAGIYRRLVACVLRQLPAGHELVVCFDPPERESEVREWLQPSIPGRDFRLLAQCRGDLGHRLERAFAALFAEGRSPIAVIGSDCVDISPTTFAHAETLLRTFDGVIGPSFDGGYYLLALKEPQPALFSGIPWSTPGVLDTTRQRATEQTLAIAELPPLHDVDDLADWERLKERVGDNG